MSFTSMLLLAATAATIGKTANITSSSAYYDRKEGFAFFSGNVSVADSEYILHADRAYVFLEGTNSLKRIVALGNVAMTNGTRCAFGSKASYYRDNGMVVLYAGDDGVAEVRETSDAGDRVVRGKKIKFWTGTEQVEVMEAEISAPRGGGIGNLRNILGR